MTDRKFCVALEGHQQKRRIEMSLSSHLEELRKKHQHLSDAVEEALKSPSSDDLQIAQLKKQKLQLKEEITRLSTH
jgi:hypothetical protein